MWTSIDDVRQAIAERKVRALAKAFDSDKPEHVGLALALEPAELTTLARNDTLAARLGAAAFALVGAGRFAEALQLFDVLVEGEPSELSIFANALYAVANGNNHLNLPAARARRYLERGRPKGPKNPHIFYNAACLAVELGDRDGAVGDARDAIRFGYPEPDQIRGDDQLKPLLNDPRFEAAFADPAVLAERATWIAPAAVVALRGLGEEEAWDPAEVDLEMLPAFESPAETRAWLESWSGKQPTAADRLRPFAQDGSGGQVVIWLQTPTAPLDRQPIVLFGSEGALGVVARDLPDFIRLLGASLAPVAVVEHGVREAGAPIRAVLKLLAKQYPDARNRSVDDVLAAAAPLAPQLLSLLGR
jgi:hypothetical protein